MSSVVSGPVSYITHLPSRQKSRDFSSGEPVKIVFSRYHGSDQETEIDESGP